MPSDFSYLYKYLPHHHKMVGPEYPAIMFFAVDGDTRFDPMSARKMTPLMQQRAGMARA